MLEIGVQTWNVVEDENPLCGFEMLRSTGFTCCDFSLNTYFKNKDIYSGKVTPFFEQSAKELCAFFLPHKEASVQSGVRIHQMHMPYPLYVPTVGDDLNQFLRKEVAIKSIELCHFLGCKYIVVHGLKLVRFLGSEELEWQETEKLIHEIAPLAAKYHITICVENLYDSVGGHLIEGPCCDVKKTVERIDRINAEYGQEVLGFCFDVGHANLIGLEFEQFLSTLGTRLKVLHIHDNDGISDLHQIPFTFTKTRENTTATDWDGFLRGLKAIAFDGVLSFETGPVLSAFPEELKVGTLQFLNEIGIYFSRQIAN